MKLHIQILPPPQEAFWAEHAIHVPRQWVLYGGTAVALRLGHRQSADFDFFSSEPLRLDELKARLPLLRSASVLRQSSDTFIITVPLAGDELKLSFMAGLAFGRVGRPDRLKGKPAIASPLDLLATKLKALHDRIEPRDYIDIEALLRFGLSLGDGIAAAMALFGSQLNPLDTAKAVAWFKDGGLDRTLTAETRRYLTAASGSFDPATRPLPLVSKKLAPT